MAFGVVPTGFVRKTLADIKTALEEAQHAASELGPAFDVSANSPAGQLNGTFASELAEAWEVLEECYHGFDVESATDYLLTQLVSLTGTTRDAATPSTVTVLCTLDAGATAPAGSVIAVDGRPDITFTLDADAENTGMSEDDIETTATCTQTGPIFVANGTLTVIVTGASGWTAVTNPNDAIEGRARDNDITLLQKQRDEIAITGGSTLAAIKADVLAVEGVNACTVLENKGDVIDGNGLTPHSIDVLIDDGDVPAADDDEIAQAIFDSAPAGVGFNGEESGTAADANGDPQIVAFDRVNLKPVYVDVFVTTNSDYPG